MTKILKIFLLYLYLNHFESTRRCFGGVFIFLEIFHTPLLLIFINDPLIAYCNLFIYSTYMQLHTSLSVWVYPYYDDITL